MEAGTEEGQSLLRRGQVSPHLLSQFVSPGQAGVRVVPGQRQGDPGLQGPHSRLVVRDRLGFGFQTILRLVDTERDVEGLEGDILSVRYSVREPRKLTTNLILFLFGHIGMDRVQARVGCHGGAGQTGEIDCAEGAH